jgi:hypothetical protein
MAGKALADFYRNLFCIEDSVAKQWLDISGRYTNILNILNHVQLQTAAALKALCFEAVLLQTICFEPCSLRLFL